MTLCGYDGPWTLFKVRVQSSDGAWWWLMLTDLDGVVCPRAGDKVGIDVEHDITTEVDSVVCTPVPPVPGGGPTVTVICKPIVRQSPAEAEDTVRDLLGLGWLQR